MSTALTVNGSAAAATTLAAAGKLFSATGGTSGNTSTKVGSGTQFKQLFAKGTTTNQSGVASIPAPTDSNFNGWMWDVTTLEGNNLLAGTWTPTIHLLASTGTTVTPTVAWYKRSSAGAYTSIGSVAGSSIALTTSSQALVFTPPSLAAMAFATGDKLVMWLWVNQTAGGATNSTISVVEATSGSTAGVASEAQAVTPGYAPTTKNDSTGVRTLVRTQVTRSAVLRTRVHTQQAMLAVLRLLLRTLGGVRALPLRARVRTQFTPSTSLRVPLGVTGGTPFQYVPRTMGGTLLSYLTATTTFLRLPVRTARSLSAPLRLLLRVQTGRSSRLRVVARTSAIRRAALRARVATLVGTSLTALRVPLRVAGSGATALRVVASTSLSQVTDTLALRLLVRLARARAAPLRVRVASGVSTLSALRARIASRVGQSAALRLSARTQAGRALSLRAPVAARARLVSMLRVPVATRVRLVSMLRAPVASRSVREIALRLALRGMSALTPLRLSLATSGSAQPSLLRTPVHSLRALLFSLRARVATGRLSLAPLRLSARTRMTYLAALRLLVTGAHGRSLALRLSLRGLSQLTLLRLRVASEQPVLRLSLRVVTRENPSRDIILFPLPTPAGPFLAGIGPGVGSPLLSFVE